MMLDIRYLMLDGSQRPKTISYKVKAGGFKFRKYMRL
jgi:hypothetical protein